MGAAEAKACALRSTAARPTVCPCLGDSEWMDAWSRSLKSSISGSAPITAIARSKAPTARSISCGSTRTDPTGLSRCTQARKLRLSRHNPGSTCVPTGNRLTTYRLIAAARPRNVSDREKMGARRSPMLVCNLTNHLLLVVMASPILHQTITSLTGDEDWSKCTLPVWERQKIKQCCGDLTSQRLWDRHLSRC